MQQMDPNETNANWQKGYGRYEGDAQFQGQDSGVKGQKLHVDEDEQFADLLTRRIKQELKSELGSGKDATIGYRLALAIVSVGILVPLLITLVIALALGVASGSALSVEHGGTGIILLWGFIGVCAVLIAVNGYFNWATSVISRKQEQNQNESRKQK